MECLEDSLRRFGLLRGGDLKIRIWVPKCIAATGSISFRSLFTPCEELGSQGEAGLKSSVLFDIGPGWDQHDAREQPTVEWRSFAAKKKTTSSNKTTWVEAVPNM